MSKIGLPELPKMSNMHGVFEEVSRVFSIATSSPTLTEQQPMANTNTKKVSFRREKLLSSWLEFAPDAMFAGFTLAQFEAGSQEPLEIRQTMEAAKTKLAGLKLKRDKAEEKLNETLVLISNSIRGTPAYGQDCELYRSLGFIPKSERKTGTVKGKKVVKTATPPPAADAA
jgi:hypothetical protein